MMKHTLVVIGALACFSVHLVSAKLHEKCEVNEDCKDRSEWCRFGLCVCHRNATRNGINVCTRQVGSSCSERDILVENSRCIDGIVQAHPKNELNSGSVPLGGKCTNDADCSSLNSHCKNGVCKCYVGIITVKGKDYCKAGGLSMQCSIPEVCRTNFTCYEGNCVCKLGYGTSGLDKLGLRCAKSTQSWYERCNNTATNACHGPRATCDLHQCYCEDLYKTIKISNKFVCKGNVSLGYPCYSYDRITTKHAHCSQENEVACDKGYVVPKNSEKCVKDIGIPLHKPCEASLQCQKKTNNSLCSTENKCECPKSWSLKKRHNQDICLKKVSMSGLCDEKSYCEESYASCVDERCTCTHKVLDACIYNLTYGQFAGIIVGVFIVLAIVIGGLVFIIIKKQRRYKRQY